MGDRRVARGVRRGRRFEVDGAKLVAALIARWGGIAAEAAGRLTPRPPVRPIPVAVLADGVLEASEARR